MRLAPTSIKRLGRDSVEVVWNDGHRSVYPNHHLRQHCPCASCRRQPPRSLPVFGAEISPIDISVVGRYAVSIEWSDRHDSGIYSYETLRQLCPCDFCHAGAAKPNAA